MYIPSSDRVVQTHHTCGVTKHEGTFYIPSFDKVGMKYIPTTSRNTSTVCTITFNPNGPYTLGHSRTKQTPTKTAWEICANEDLLRAQCGLPTRNDLDQIDQIDQIDRLLNRSLTYRYAMLCRTYVQVQIRPRKAMSLKKHTDCYAGSHTATSATVHTCQDSYLS